MATEIWQTKISQLNEIVDWQNSYTIVTDKNGQSVKAPLVQVSKIGDLSQLTTTAKNTLVAAINEAATTGNITVDSALSSSSTNPVQNKVINTALAGKQETLVGSGTGQNLKTINNESLLGTGNIEVEGHDGVGFDSITTPATADGTAIITLTNGDTITLDLNHDHTSYPKYQLCANQAAYDAITTKDSGTLYLILESQS